MKAEELNFEDARYSVAGYSGIAFYLHKWPAVWEPHYVYFPAEDDCQEEWAEEGGEWVHGVPGDNVVAIMVGDDREFIIDIDDLTLLDDKDYCYVCGQVGCKGDFR